MKLVTVCLALVCLSTTIHAEPTRAQKDAFDKAVKAVRATMVRGPGSITLLKKGTLDLPAGDIYVPQPAAGQYMKALGNPADKQLVGVVMPANKGNWLTVIRYLDSGHIADDDAASWDVDELLQSIKDGTEKANEIRKRDGYPELLIDGWVRKPHYDAHAHHLVWSISAHQSGHTGDNTINYKTYALGREGYFSLNLITDLSDIDRYRPAAAELLDDLHYNDGKRYADFDASTDHMAEYGLAALITGVAAKKLGLLALAGAFLAKSFKLILVGVAVFFGGIRKFFSRAKS